MTRTDILALFRSDNPEITQAVLSDALVYKYLIEADKEACAISKCIVGEATFDSVASSTVYAAKYNLTDLIENFYAIDDNPGGGVIFDGDKLDKTTIAELDNYSSSWRNRSAGTPKKYYQRNNFLYFDYPVATAGLDIMVYAVLLSDDFDDDAKEPFNSLSYLRPYHSSLNLYLKWKGKQKIGKSAEAQQARQDFIDYCKWFGKEVAGQKFGKIFLQPKAGYAK